VLITVGHDFAGAYVAAVRHEFDRQLLEGVGVIPDHRVERPLPYASGADPVLDTALDLLAQQARQTRAPVATAPRQTDPRNVVRRR
jgi:hypothetical protein